MAGSVVRRPHPRRACSPRGRAAASVAVAAVAALAACGTTVPGAATSSGAPSTSGSGAGPTELVVVVDDGAGATSTWRLTCDPPGGTHPDPSAACAALASGGDRSLPPVRPDQGCTQVYGGPQTATLTGTWRGTPVETSFSRTDGCQIARWDGLAGLLPAGDGSGAAAE